MNAPAQRRPYLLPLRQLAEAYAALHSGHHSPNISIRWGGGGWVILDHWGGADYILCDDLPDLPVDHQDHWALVRWSRP